MVHGEVVGLMNGELVMGGILEGDCKDELWWSGTTTPFYGPFSRTTRVSRCRKRTSGLYGARED